MAAISQPTARGSCHLRHLGTTTDNDHEQIASNNNGTTNT
nr:MAG TPA: hypothetical protein [Caudoviricetes sp.]